MKAQVKKYVITELLSGEEISDDEDLLLSGLVESIGVMRLVTFLEQQFGIKIPPRDVTVENFASINAICHYLEGRLNP